ncbi:DUF4832 domain-containing protein [Antrihabitans sp. YC3-6]|uniref:DUF4832 domain-containing protein n=1 Tax=Antrihabitans stalagmiti TaxID=2799499 RepID=A0A934NSP6_9NOCA|nr:DUF4832 domain-containing protein [Antrihabitans stalagmiti]MBJ8340475.1 DUF4832 domain-containing protein [Antrihabitans stalagmiti]
MTAVTTATVISSCATSSDLVDDPAPRGVIEFSAPDLVNPLRGQYENLVTDLFPQSNPAQSQFPTWPGTSDTSARIDWRLLQPEDPRNISANADDEDIYDFSKLDAIIENAGKTGRRVGFRITSFNSCCQDSYPDNTDISVPDWLRTIEGATQDYDHNGVTYVIPNWNDESYLSYFADLLGALGRRYNKDERVAVFEMSGYGDFSENHVAFMRDELGIPAPEPEQSEAELGYFSQYRDQYITSESIEYLVEANLRAFPDTQIVASLGNPQITKELMRDSPALADVVKPVGNRSDGLGAYRPIPTWAENEFSRYVQTGDPIVDIVRNRFRIAPTITEWPPQFLKGGTEREYYETGLRDVVNDHVSMTASTGFPAQRSADRMPDDLYDLWSRANKYAGYRYAVSSSAIPTRAAPRADVPMTFDWTNFGTAPTYEAWKPQYDILDASGTVVRTIDSRIDLRELYAEQSYDDLAASPASRTETDLVMIDGGLAPGEYSVRVRVLWGEMKTDATYSVAFRPMELAQYTRDPDGGYLLGEFTVA